MTFFKKLFIFTILIQFSSTSNEGHSQYFLEANNSYTIGSHWTNETKGNTEQNKVKIKVYYETLCPASVDFFSSQLQPVVEKLASHLDVHLIPYGHAKTWRVRDTSLRRDRYKFSCQHGPAECYGNKMHACSVDALQNNTQAVLFNACLMQYSAYRVNIGYEYVSALNWVCSLNTRGNGFLMTYSRICGFKLDVLIHGIWQCVNSGRGSVLLKGYGDETHKLRPRYVPYVVVGSADQQDQVTENLMTTVCNLLPTAACN